MKTLPLTLLASLTLGFTLSTPAQGQGFSRQSLSGGAHLHRRPADRVPAEWELHEATWMQWPRWYESTSRPAFAEIIGVLQNYEPMHIVANSQGELSGARNFLTGRGVPLGNITFHVMPMNSSWMRDNGPVWVERGGRLVAQDWGFDGWGGLTWDFYDDNLIPPLVAAVEGAPCEDWTHLIHERGNLEFNGRDTVILSWPCFSSRNPSWTQAQLTWALKRAFGVTKVVWLLSAPSDDVTGGHVDGIARFIDEDTVVVPRYVSNHPEAWVYDEAASIVQAAGFQVLRMDVPGEVWYGGAWMSAIYVNWLVANDVVIIPGFNKPQWDKAARQAVQGYFPGRKVQTVDTRELWYWGGSVHCVTNDQPHM